MEATAANGSQACAPNAIVTARKGSARNQNRSARRPRTYPVLNTEGRAGASGAGCCRTGEVARSLDLGNYNVLLHNKYSGEWDKVAGRFDFIVDNNPTSPCCCISHLAALFEFYDACLSPDGQIVTDCQGVAWVPEDTNPRWSFDFDDLAAAAAVAGFTAFRMNKKVYVLSRSPPRAPDVAALSRHQVRRAIMLPGKVIRSAPRQILRTVRGLAKHILVAAVPWALPARYRTGK